MRPRPAVSTPQPELGPAGAKALLGRPLDVLLIAAAFSLHLLACAGNGILRPVGAFETGLLVLPLVAQALAAGLLLVRRDMRGLQGACLFQWLVVLYLLPAHFLGLAFAPSALALSLALARPGRPD